jgi:hypothetical protein
MADASAASRTAALAILCTDLRGGRNAPYAAPFVGLARSYRKQYSLNAYYDAEWPEPPTDEEESDEGDQQADTAEDAVDERLTAGLDYLRDLGQHVERILSQSREEMDATWWIVGEYSRDLEVPVRDLEPTQAPLILAKEFADMTRTDLGPVGAKAVLARMLGHVDNLPVKVKIVDVVESLPPGWRSALNARISDGEMPDGMYPILSAVARHEELGGDHAWQATFAKTTGLTAAKALAPIDIATQVYDELLLLRMTRKPLHSATREEE